MRVGVVGGGAVGLVIAGDLATRGVDVTLYECKTFGSGATGRAAGICYDAFADPVDAAVADRALERYRSWGLLETCPYVWLARTESDAKAVSQQVNRMQALGRAVEQLSATDLAERYPVVDTSEVTVAAIAHSAGTLDPERVVASLARRAREAGATLRPEMSASLADPTVVETAAGIDHFDAVVVAAGPATKPLVADVGVSLALATYRAQALVTGPIDGTLPSLYDASREFYWRPHGEGVLVGDGAHAVDPDDWNSDADPEFVSEAIERFRRATMADPSVERSWAGCCTATPDRDPLAGAVTDGLWVATGWQGHGLMRAPATGEFLVNCLCGSSATVDASLTEQFDPTRFDGEESFHPLGDPTAEW